MSNLIDRIRVAQINAGEREVLRQLGQLKEPDVRV